MRLGRFVFRIHRESPPFVAPDAAVIYPLQDRHGQRRGIWLLAVLTGAYTFAISYHNHW